MKPKKVTGCVLEYQYVEVTHACIQILLTIFALLFGITLTHYLVTVVEPKYRKSKLNQSLNSNGNAVGNGGHTMYSIQVNESSMSNLGHQNNTQETDFYNSLEAGHVAGNGDVRPQMTPRRVKRRSYTRSSARSAGKQLKKDLRASGRSIRSAGGAVVAAGGRPGKAVNPVTRLMQETEPHHTALVNDSSTSNEDGRHAERYGQVNPGYVSSRPNSLYSHATNNGGGPTSITDYEASRPPSALTSYSNFHGQRRPPLGQHPHGHGDKPYQPGSLVSNHLTQESLVHFDNNAPGGHVNLGASGMHQPMLNNSFDDDLPPPPPPLSSSPTNMNHHGREDTDNNSSITTDTTAQVYSST